MNFFKLYIGDYQRDTGCLSIAEHGVYFLMLQYHYATEKPLPTGKDLYRLLRCSTKADRDAVDVVAKQFWQESPGGLVNSRATKEMAEAHAYAEAQSTRAHKRWDKQKDMPAHMQVHEQVQCPIDASHSHSHSQTLKPKAERRGSRLSLTEIPESWRSFCMQERPNLSPEMVFAKFRDYWIANPKGTKLDWDATWRNWVRAERTVQTTSKTSSALMSLEGLKNDPTRIQRRDGEWPAEVAGFIPAKHATG